MTQNFKKKKTSKKVTIFMEFGKFLQSNQFYLRDINFLILAKSHFKYIVKYFIHSTCIFKHFLVAKIDCGYKRKNIVIL